MKKADIKHKHDCSICMGGVNRDSDLDRVTFLAPFI